MYNKPIMYDFRFIGCLKKRHRWNLEFISDTKYALQIYYVIRQDSPRIIVIKKLNKNASLLKQTYLNERMSLIDLITSNL